MSLPSSCRGVYGLTSAMRSFGSLIHRKGAIMVTVVPTIMTAAARSSRMTGFFSIMEAPFLDGFGCGGRTAAGRRLVEVVDEDEETRQVDESADRPAVPVGIHLHQG